jgi:hypothetical protein
MTSKPKLINDGRSVTVRVPISIKTRGGRKLILAPGGAALTAAPVHRRIDTAIVKAIARAFRWRELLESGQYSTVREIAAAEKINDSYVSRVLRLTLLAPDIVESILDGRQPHEITLPALMRRFSSLWQTQRAAFRLVDAPHALVSRPREQRSF